MALTKNAWTAAVVAALALGAAGTGRAQDPPKDDALDRLLEKLEGKPGDSPKDEPKKDAAKDKEKDKKADEKKDAAKKDGEKKADAKKSDEKAKPADKSKDKPKSDEPEDKALDSLLERLGESKDKPKTTGQSGGDADKPADHPEQAGDLPDLKTRPEKDAPRDMIRPDQKPLDEHLEELTGRIKKKKNQQGQGGQQGQQGGQEGQQGGEDDENTPIGRAVKKMRQVQNKLGEEDTGEETRKTQGEIVKDLDNLIAQARRSAQMQRTRGRRMRPGQQQPGDPNGDQTGTQGDQARGAPPMKPKDPKDVASMAGDKNTWGNLPAMLREEMENVFRAEPLPAKAERISRYYRAVATKGSSSSRGE